MTLEEFQYQQSLQEQRALFRECFPETVGTSMETDDHYRWKFHGSPVPPQSYEFIARNEEGAIIGYYAGLPYPYRIRGEEVHCGMVCDVMTTRSQQRKGVFSKLSIYANEVMARRGASFSIAYPIRKKTIPAHFRSGFRIVFPLPLYMRFLKTDSLPLFRSFPPLRWLANPLLRLVNALFLRKPCECSVRHFTNRQIDEIEGYDELYGAWSAGLPQHLLKTKDFLKWRLNAPGKDYTLIAVYGTGMLQALAVTRLITTRGVPSLGILDVMSRNPADSYKKELFNAVYRHAREVGAHSVLTMMSATWSRKYRLACNGFFRSPFTFYVIMKNLNGHFSDEVLFTESNWHLMWIDSDDL